MRGFSAASARTLGIGSSKRAKKKKPRKPRRFCPPCFSKVLQRVRKTFLASMAWFATAGVLALVGLGAIAFSGEATADALDLGGARAYSWLFFAAAAIAAVPPLRLTSSVITSGIYMCIPTSWYAARLYVISCRGPGWRVAWTAVFPFAWSAILGPNVLPDIRIRLVLVLAAAAVLEAVLTLALRAYRQTSHLAAFSSKVEALQRRIRGLQAITLLAASVAAARKRFYVLFPARSNKPNAPRPPPAPAARPRGGSASAASGPGSPTKRRVGFDEPGSAKDPGAIGGKDKSFVDVTDAADDSEPLVRAAGSIQAGRSAAAPAPVAAGTPAAPAPDHDAPMGDPTLFDGVRRASRRLPQADAHVHLSRSGTPPAHLVTGRNPDGRPTPPMPPVPGAMIKARDPPPAPLPASHAGRAPPRSMSLSGLSAAARGAAAASVGVTSAAAAVSASATPGTAAVAGTSSLGSARRPSSGGHGAHHHGPHSRPPREWSFVPDVGSLTWRGVPISSVVGALLFCGARGRAKEAEMLERYGTAEEDEDDLGGGAQGDGLVAGIGTPRKRAGTGFEDDEDDDEDAAGPDAAASEGPSPAVLAAAASLGLTLPGKGKGLAHAAAAAAAAAASGNAPADGGDGGTVRGATSLTSLLGMRRVLGRGKGRSSGDGALPLFVPEQPKRGRKRDAALPTPALIGALTSRAARRVMTDAFAHLDYKRSGRVTLEMLAGRVGLPMHIAAEALALTASVPAASLSRRDFSAAGAKLVRDVRALGRTVEDFGAVATAVRLAAMAVWGVLVLFVGLWAFEVSLLDVVVPFGLLFTSLSFAAGEPARLTFMGLFIMTMYAPYEVGDRVSINGARPMTVVRIEAAATWLRTVAGRELMISNHTLLDATVENYMRCKLASVELLFTVGYRTSHKQLDALVEAVVAYTRGLPTRWTEDGASFMIKDGSGVDGRLNFVIWLEHRRSWAEAGEVLTDSSRATLFIIDAMQRLGIEYVEPPRPLLIRNEEDTAAAATGARPWRLGSSLRAERLAENADAVAAHAAALATSFEPPQVGSVGKTVGGGSYDERVAASKMRRRFGRH